MRNLQLSHEQIELIQQALGIAEKKFSDIHETIIKDTVLVRGVNSPTLKTNENNKYFLISTKFADLNMNITDGTHDI